MMVKVLICVITAVICGSFLFFYVWGLRHPEKLQAPDWLVENVKQLSDAFRASTVSVYDATEALQEWCRQVPISMNGAEKNENI